MDEEKAQQAAIDAFWSWWAEAAGRLATAVQKGGYTDAMSDEVTGRVKAIHPDLVWELGPGRKAQHYFCLSAGGVIALRPIAERWRASAPSPTAAWEFFSSRQPHRDGNPSVNVFGESFAAEDLLFSIAEDPGRERLDIAVFHPDFPAMPEDVRNQVSFLLLDGVLGEDGVERWLGSIEVLDDGPDDVQGLSDLLRRVDDLSRDATGQKWRNFRVNRGKAVALVAFNEAAKAIDHIEKDHWITLRIPLQTADKTGMPTKAEILELREAENDLVAELGAKAMLLCREVGAGAWSVHLRGTAEAPEIVKDWAADMESLRSTVEVRRDREWAALRMFE